MRRRIDGKTWSRSALRGGIEGLALLALLAWGSASRAQTFDLSEAPVKGDPGAPLALVAFSDFQCGFCARAAREVLPRIEKAYAGEGKLQIRFFDFPLDSLHRHARRAAGAARCAGEQGRFWAMHDVLFAHHSALQPEQLPGYADRAGLDAEAFTACMERGGQGKGINRDRTQGLKAGVGSTPTFYLARLDPETGRARAVRKLLGAQPFEAFAAAIDEALEKVPAAAGPEGPEGEP